MHLSNSNHGYVRLLTQVSSTYGAHWRVDSKCAFVEIDSHIIYSGYERFVNFHGQHGARLSRLQSIRPDSKKRTLMMIILSPTLFFAPDIHLKNIEEVWIDRMVLQEPWSDFIDNLVREWEGFVLYVGAPILFHIKDVC